MIKGALIGGISGIVTTSVSIYMMNRVPADEYDDNFQIATNFIASCGTGFAVGAITAGALLVLDGICTEACLQLTT